MYKNAEELSRHANNSCQAAASRVTLMTTFEKELVRFLHNYLTSVYSLIEAQRVVMRHCWGEDSEVETGEYTAHRKASFETGEAEFMTELRNYCTHRSVPLPSIITTFSGDADDRLADKQADSRQRRPAEVEEMDRAREGVPACKRPQFDLGPVIESYVDYRSGLLQLVRQRDQRAQRGDQDRVHGSRRSVSQVVQGEMGMNTEGYRKLFGPPGLLTLRRNGCRVTGGI